MDLTGAPALGVVGNLRDSPLGDILLRLQRERRSGVLRLRSNGPDGTQRIDLVLRDGKLVGAAKYRNGGVLGMGDALVDEALAAPEDAEAAQDHAAKSCQHPIGALAEGAARVGVSYERVVQTLATHIENVMNEARGWTNGSGEFLLDGFPENEVDKDSAAARAFVLDDGIPPSRLVGVPDPGDFEATQEASEASVSLSDMEFTHPDELSHEAPTAPQFAAPPPSPEDEDWFAEEPTAPPPPVPPPVPKPAVASAKPEIPMPSPRPKADAPIFAQPPTAPPPKPVAKPIVESAEEKRERIRRVGEAARAARRAKQEARAKTSAEASPFRADADPDHTMETDPGVVPAANEPTHQMAAASSNGAHEVTPPPEDDDAPDESGASDGIDYSTPGFGEAALMEAEQLLDSEVLGVMLEMGSSAAGKAVPETISTGHVLLVDDEGQLLPMLVPPLRESGLVVHTVNGLSDAIDRMNEASGNAQRPLVVCDLLIKRGDGGGMLGGIDVAKHGNALEPTLPVVLLAETMSDDVRDKAEDAGVKAILERPLRAELKKDQAARESFIAELLSAIEEHRPKAEWQAPGDAGPWTAPPAEEGWNVEEIEQQAREVEDLPMLDGEPRTARREALWRETMHELSGPLSQPEILLVVLRFAAEVFDRAVLFTPAGVELVGFGQFGVELAPGVDPDQAVREIRLPPDGHPGVHASVVQRIAQRMKPGESTWETYLTRALGGIAPDEAFFGPVFCQGRLAAVLYGDALGTDGSLPETTNLEVVLGQAGLALDRSVLEARIKALEGK